MSGLLWRFWAKRSLSWMVAATIDRVYSYLADESSIFIVSQDVVKTHRIALGANTGGLLAIAQNAVSSNIARTICHRFSAAMCISRPICHSRTLIIHLGLTICDRSSLAICMDLSVCHRHRSAICIHCVNMSPSSIMKFTSYYPRWEIFAHRNPFLGCLYAIVADVRFSSI